MIQADLNIILPEISLSLLAIGALLGAVYTSKDKMGPVLVWATAAVFLALALWIGLSGEGTNEPLAECSSTMRFRALQRLPFCCPLLPFW